MKYRIQVWVDSDWDPYDIGKEVQGLLEKAHPHEDYVEDVEVDLEDAR